jgi:hypothetical protein
MHVSLLKAHLIVARRSPSTTKNVSITSYTLELSGPSIAALTPQTTAIVMTSISASNLT